MHTTTPSIRRHAPRLLALALLGALAMPAFAQSAEYRRGYDEGYRAGVAAAQSGNVQPQGPYGAAYQPVRVERADYGTAGQYCDARAALQQRLDTERNNVVRSDNGLCGDPAPGQVKQLTVRLRCQKSGVQRLVVAENQAQQISCR
ncbi:MAG TPA: hypothetical protein VGE70_02725 [Burkholderiaceae bacterium]